MKKEKKTTVDEVVTNKKPNYSDALDVHLDAFNPDDWLKSWSVSEHLKEEIKRMSKADKEKAFSRGRLAFGTAGIRAKMGPGTQQLNRFVYEQMIVGYVGYVKKFNKNPKILIAHDNRMYGAEFAMACAQVASLMGVEVYLFQDNKLMPTPIVSYVIRRLGLDGAVNITASHNPKQDNGFKAYNKLGCQILPDEAKIIIDNMPDSGTILNIENDLIKVNKNPVPIKYINYDKIVDEYFDEVIDATVLDKSFLSPKAAIKDLPIVFTGFQGTTTELMPRFLKKLGFKKVITVPGQNIISGKFEASPLSNPEDVRAFHLAIQTANDKKATVIFGCDPDGDRMSMGFKKTNRWRFLNGNEMGILFVNYILMHKKFTKIPYILSSQVSTNYIDKIANQYGAKVIRTKTGFKWMCNQIDELEERGNFVCAFEEAIGSLVHTKTRDKDGFGAICLALEIFHWVSEYYVDLHEYLMTNIYEKYGESFSNTVAFTIDSEDWNAEAKKLMEKALHFDPNYKLFDYKIKKIWFNPEADAIEWLLDKNSWIKFRISGTEPKFKIYFCLNDQMIGQLKTAGFENLKIILNTVLAGVKFK